MASLLVVIELVEDRPRPASIELLGQARRVATALGATLYAVAPCARPPGYGDDDLIAILSRHGADKVLLATSDAHTGPLRWGTHGGAVLAACSLMHPALVLLADGEGARDLGGRVASRLGAAALCDAFVEAGEGGVVLWQGAGESALSLDGELDFAVLTLVPPGRYLAAIGDEEAEVEMLEPGAPERDFEPAGPAGSGGAWPRVAILGEGDAAAVLARATAGTRDAQSSAELRIAIGAEHNLLGEFCGEASCRIAIGEHASQVTAAHYALDGVPEELARAVAIAVGSGNDSPARADGAKP